MNYRVPHDGRPKGFVGRHHAVERTGDTSRAGVRRFMIVRKQHSTADGGAAENAVIGARANGIAGIKAGGSIDRMVMPISTVTTTTISDPAAAKRNNPTMVTTGIAGRLPILDVMHPISPCRRRPDKAGR